jgi:TorA maturation chaperone TorD
MNSVDFLERRALAFCLASRLTAWPDDETLADARVLAEGLGDGEGEAAEQALVSLAARAERARFEREYLTLFENGASRVPVHETEYGRMRGMAKGNELADIAGFYAAFGMTRADGDAARQLGDHLAVELEFYGTLLAKQAALLELADAEGQHVVLDARRKFLGDHLGRLALAVASQGTVQGSEVYGPLLAATSALVKAECASLEVTPAPMDFLPDQAEPEALCCAT